MRLPSIVLIVCAACGGAPAAPPAATPAPAPAPPPPAPASATKAASAADRLAFNQGATRQNLPLFWVRDTDGDGQPDADELKPLLFYPGTAQWAKPETLAAELPAAIGEIKSAPADDITLAPEEAKRRRLVAMELDQGAPALVANDLRSLPAGEKEFVRHILAATAQIDALYARMAGTPTLAPQVKDVASQSMFRRNWGPKCVAPRTAAEPACNAIAGAPSPVVDVYPASLQRDPGFCAALEKRKDAARLLSPFVVVREGKRAGELVAVPYPKAYPEEMGAIAGELRAAAAALGEGEPALRAYLTAAAQSFQTNDWLPADEAWAKMNAQNSRWYLRIGPDETYWEPCSQKAGFHVTFGLISKDSLRWQDKLAPELQSMESRLAALIGKPYRERKVSIHLPDFLDVVINAGDDRKPFGATIGQSLPNWGKVADEGRGRTMAVTNLFADPDSKATRREQASALLSAAMMGSYGTGDDPGLLSTILHEATHNLGPAHDYQVGGKEDGLVFGGGLASMLEELKAQSGTLFFVEELRKRGVIDDKLARETWVDSMVWCLGQISRGMVDESGRMRPYPQLAAIQIGFLLDQGALVWERAGKAANGSDVGAFTIDMERFPAAAEALMKKVGAIKATGDKAGAEALIKRYVEGETVPRGTIAERFLRQPKESFVYALDL